MQLRNPKDFWAGVLFAAIGITFAVVVQVYEYPIGNTRRMGPGFFPLAIAVILAIMGLVIVAKAFVTDGEAVSKFAWRPLLWILGGVVLFGVLVKTIGLVLGIVMLVLVSAYGGHEFKLKEQLIAATILAIGCTLVFVKGLKLAFPIWPIFLS